MPNYTPELTVLVLLPVYFTPEVDPRDAQEFPCGTPM